MHAEFLASERLARMDWRLITFKQKIGKQKWMKLAMLWNKLGAKAVQYTLLAVINLTPSKSLLQFVLHFFI
jgi:hypothetical protein